MRSHSIFMTEKIAKPSLTYHQIGTAKVFLYLICLERSFSAVDELDF